MSRKVKSMFFVFVIASLILTACGGGGGGGGDEPIKVGAIFDLTGATGDVGTPYAEGVKGYIEWLNNQGGVEGHPIELISADYAYKVDVAEQLYTQYVSEGVVAAGGVCVGAAPGFPPNSLHISSISTDLNNALICSFLPISALTCSGLFFTISINCGFLLRISITSALENSFALTSIPLVGHLFKWFPSIIGRL